MRALASTPPTPPHDRSGTITRAELETAMKTRLKMGPKQVCTSCRRRVLPVRSLRIARRGGFHHTIGQSLSVSPRVAPTGASRPLSPHHSPSALLTPVADGHRWRASPYPICALRNRHMRVTQIDALFNETDADGNGTITMQEFSVAVRKVAAAACNR